ncbi:MAG: hypothetical protein KatS3mg026_1780 [Bacteroidia bacterium]|nr:MAG: hypothetical protein KatS3mg026_1780 [Bacteroidia bacterium]
MLSVERGYTRFVWPGLPPQAAPPSLRVSVPPTAGGYVVQTTIEPYSPTWQGEPPDALALRQQIDSLEGVVARLTDRLRILALQESTLTQNLRLGGEEGTVQPEQVERYLALLERQLGRLLAERFPLEKRHKALADTLARWKKRYKSRLAGLSQARSALYLTYWSPQREVVPVRVEFIAPTASWRLQYRIRAMPTAGQLRIQRWATLYNYSGEDWKGIPLTLSTAQPTESAQMPSFVPWYLDFAQVYPMGRYRLQEASSPAGKADALADLADYEAPQEPTAPPPLPTLSEQTLSRTYALGPQTVRAGQQSTQVFLREDTLPATFQFFVNAPAEERAYLRAGLPPEALGLWEKAPARLEVDGQEVGQVAWPPPLTEDTLWLDLGPADRIQVRRTETLNRREARLTGSTMHHRFAYTIRVTHSYPAPIRITVWERLPVSRHADIKVEPEELAGGTLDKDTGKLRWDFSLEVGQTWERTFRFTVKYPKGKPIVGL